MVWSFSPGMLCDDLKECDGGGGVGGKLKRKGIYTYTLTADLHYSMEETNATL